MRSFAKLEIMPTVEIENIAKLSEFVGREVAASDWFEITQAHINQFADATEDRQWIHVDEQRAAAESPFKTAIAHGFLTVSLLSHLAETAMSVRNVRMGVNYGFNRVRFVAPVAAGSRIRGRFNLMAIEEITGGLQAVWNVVIERENHEKPACVAEWIVRYYD